MPPRSLSPRLLTGLIIVAVAIWGLYLAVGSYLYNHNPWRAVVVFGCFAAYLGFWLLMLRTRRLPKRD